MICEKFYYVVGEGRGAPTKKHNTEESAYSEAVRLAKLYPNVPFHVVAIKCSVKGAVHVETDFYI